MSGLKSDMFVTICSWVWRIAYTMLSPGKPSPIH